MKEKTDIKAFILKKYIQKQRDLTEDAVLAYGTVITKDGRILTVTEMESFYLQEQNKGI